MMQAAPDQAALAAWIKLHEQQLAQMVPKSRKIRDNARDKQKVRIWLGGSKRVMYEQRATIAELLRHDGFDVDYTDCQSPEELSAYNIAIVIVLTEGTVAEAIELVWMRNLECELLIHMPDKLHDSYVYRALQRRSAIKDTTIFALTGFDEWDAELPLHIVRDADSIRKTPFNEL
jgi:hypothetical protein